MTIGEKIKLLRRQSDVTQEKLADYLNISYQAISKWENNSALPDITLVVPIANFFGVTTDALFGLDSEAAEKELAEYEAKDHELAHEGFIDERITLWRSAALRYPKNYTCLSALANALWRSRGSGNLSFEEKARNLRESIEINERILEDCTDSVIRACARQILVYSYADDKYPTADEGKAVEYAQKADSYVVSREKLLVRARCTEEGKKKAEVQKHFNTLCFADEVTRNLRDCGFATPEERIFAYESAIRLWSTLIYDGNFLFYHCRLSDLYGAVAKNYALLKNRAKTLENLRQAKYHAESYDSLPDGKQNYTSVFVANAFDDRSGHTKNYTESDAQLFINELSDSVYDFLRGDAEFAELQNSF